MMRRYWGIERYYISLVPPPAVDRESHRTEQSAATTKRLKAKEERE